MNRPDHRERTRVPALLLLLLILVGHGFGVLENHRVVSVVGGFLSAVLFVLLVIDAPTTYWFNRPKFRVPPRMRADLGKWQENGRRWAWKRR